MNNNSIRPLTEEEKAQNDGYRAGALVNLMSLKDAEAYLASQPRPVYPQSWVLNQGEFEVNNDECGGVSASRVLSFLNGYHVGPHFLWMMTRLRANSKITDYGVSNLDLAKTMQKVGALRFEDEQFTFASGRDVIQDPLKWTNVPALTVKAAEQAIGSYIWITAHDGNDAYDIYRRTIATLNKLYGKTHGAVFGLMWDYPMSDYFIDQPKERGSGHDVPLIWPRNADNSIILQSYGLDAGHNGEQLIFRAVFNRWAETFGCFVPIDATREQIDALKASGGKLGAPWIQNFIMAIVALFKKKLITLPQLQTKEEEVITPVIPPQITQPQPPMPTKPATATLENFCLAIREHEGWFPGSRSQNNNNPGNFKFNPSGYRSIYGNVDKDAGGFARFKDYATGWLYLNNFTKNVMNGVSETYNTEAKRKFALASGADLSIRQYFLIYCENDPLTPENDPIVYGDFVAKKLGVDTSFKMKDLIIA